VNTINIMFTVGEFPVMIQGKMESAISNHNDCY